MTLHPQEKLGCKICAGSCGTAIRHCSTNWWMWKPQKVVAVSYVACGVACLYWATANHQSHNQTEHNKISLHIIDCTHIISYSYSLANQTLDHYNQGQTRGCLFSCIQYTQAVEVEEFNMRFGHSSLSATKFNRQGMSPTMMSVQSLAYWTCASRTFVAKAACHNLIGSDSFLPNPL